MGLIVITADKGAPGVTTAAVALAAVWPRPVLLAECDPAGGDIIYRLPSAEGGRLDPRRGLLSLAIAARRGAAPGLVWEHAQKLRGGLDVLVGVANAEQGAGLDLMWDQVGAALAAVPEADVIADCGRLGADSRIYDLLARADAVVLVTRAHLGDLVRLRDRAGAIEAAIRNHGGLPGRLGALVVADHKHFSTATADVRQVLSGAGCPVSLIGGLAHEPRSAEMLSGDWGGRLDKTMLIRTAREIAAHLASRIQPSLAQSPAAQSQAAQSRAAQSRAAQAPGAQPGAGQRGPAQPGPGQRGGSGIPGSGIPGPGAPGAPPGQSADGQPGYRSAAGPGHAPPGQSPGFAYPPPGGPGQAMPGPSPSGQVGYPPAGQPARGGSPSGSYPAVYQPSGGSRSSAGDPAQRAPGLAGYPPAGGPGPALPPEAYAAAPTPTPDRVTRAGTDTGPLSRTGPLPRTGPLARTDPATGPVSVTGPSGSGEPDGSDADGSDAGAADAGAAEAGPRGWDTGSRDQGGWGEGRGRHAGPGVAAGPGGR